MRILHAVCIVFRSHRLNKIVYDFCVSGINLCREPFLTGKPVSSSQLLDFFRIPATPQQFRCGESCGTAYEEVFENPVYPVDMTVGIDATEGASVVASRIGYLCEQSDIAHKEISKLLTENEESEFTQLSVKQMVY